MMDQKEFQQYVANVLGKMSKEELQAKIAEIMKLPAGERQNGSLNWKIKQAAQSALKRAGGTTQRSPGASKPSAPRTANPQSPRVVAQRQAPLAGASMASPKTIPMQDYFGGAQGQSFIIRGSRTGEQIPIPSGGGKVSQGVKYPQPTNISTPTPSVSSFNDTRLIPGGRVPTGRSGIPGVPFRGNQGLPPNQPTSQRIDLPQAGGNAVKRAPELPPIARRRTGVGAGADAGAGAGSTATSASPTTTAIVRKGTQEVSTGGRIPVESIIVEETPRTRTGGPSAKPGMLRDIGQRIKNAPKAVKIGAGLLAAGAAGYGAYNMLTRKGEAPKEETTGFTPVSGAGAGAGGKPVKEFASEGPMSRAMAVTNEKAGMKVDEAKAKKAAGYAFDLSTRIGKSGWDQPAIERRGEQTGKPGRERILELFRGSEVYKDLNAAERKRAIDIFRNDYDKQRFDEKQGKPRGRTVTPTQQYRASPERY
jgi:hypothetical protein